MGSVLWESVLWESVLWESVLSESVPSESVLPEEFSAGSSSEVPDSARCCVWA